MTKPWGPQWWRDLGDRRRKFHELARQKGKSPTELQLEIEACDEYWTVGEGARKAEREVQKAIKAGRVYTPRWGGRLNTRLGFAWKDEAKPETQPHLSTAYDQPRQTISEAERAEILRQPQIRYTDAYRIKRGEEMRRFKEQRDRQRGGKP